MSSYSTSIDIGSTTLGMDIEYTFIPGQKGNRDEPAEGGSVDITELDIDQIGKIKLGNPLFDLIVQDESLIDEIIDMEQEG